MNADEHIRYDDEYAGLVADDADPLLLGRIKIKVGALGDDFTTEWAMPSGLITGANSGSFYPPPVGAGVMVSFLEGDPEVAVYGGGFWSAPGGTSEVPEEFQRNPPTNRGYKSPGGHLLEYDDADDTKAIRLTTIGGHKIGFDDALTKIYMQSTAGQMFVMDDTAGAELLQFLHKTGSQLQFDPAGSFIASAQGHLIYMNAEAGEFTLIHKDGALVKMGDDGSITISDKSGQQVLTLKDQAIEMFSSKNVILNATSVQVLAGTVDLGSQAVFSAVLAEQLEIMYDGHMHATAVGPSGPPLPPFTAAINNANPALSWKAKNVKLQGNV